MAASGTVAVSASANPNTPAQRDDTIAGQTFTVTQAAAAAPTLLRRRANRSAARGGGSTAVTARPVWVDGRSNNTAWLTVTSGASGSGPGTWRFSASANPTTTPRSGTITIGARRSGHPGGRRGTSRRTRRVNRCGGGRQRVDGGDDAGRVCVDGRQQQYWWLTVTSGASGSGSAPWRSVRRLIRTRARAQGRSPSGARRSASRRRPRPAPTRCADESISRRGGGTGRRHGAGVRGRASATTRRG